MFRAHILVAVIFVASHSTAQEQPPAAQNPQAQRKLEAATARFFDRSNDRRKDALKKAKDELGNATAKLREVERKPVLPGAKADDDRGFATPESKLRWIQASKQYVESAEKELRAVEANPENYPYVLALPLKVDDIGAIPRGRGIELAKTDDGKLLVELLFHHPTKENPDARTITSVLVRLPEKTSLAASLRGAFRVVGNERRVINGVQVTAPVLEPINGRELLLGEYHKRGLIPAKAGVAAKPAGQAPPGKAAVLPQAVDNSLAALSRHERLQLFAARSEAQRQDYIGRVLQEIANLKTEQNIAEKAPIDPKFRGQAHQGFRDETSKIEYLARFPEKLAEQQEMLAVLERNDPFHAYLFAAPPQPGDIGRFPQGLIDLKRVSDKEMLLTMPHEKSFVMTDLLKCSNRDQPNANVIRIASDIVRPPADLQPTKYLVLGEFAENAPRVLKNSGLFQIEVLGRERRVVLGVPIEILVARQVDAAKLIEELRANVKQPANGKPEQK